ncbi:hypothetical protein ACOJVP_01520 [Mycobacterium sp. THU-M116]
MAFVEVLNHWYARHRPTPQQRANRYLSRMPISVLAAAQSPDGANNRR